VEQPTYKYAAKHKTGNYFIEGISADLLKISLKISENLYCHVE